MKLMHIIVISAFVFLFLFFIIDHFLKKYKFKNRFINFLIVLNAIFTNPFNMFIAFYVSWNVFSPNMNYLLKLFIFLSSMVLCTGLKFGFWGALRKNQKFELPLILEFSKRYVYHFFLVVYLPFICMEDVLSMRGDISTALILYILFTTVLLCVFYMYFSSKYILKPNFLNKILESNKKE